MRLAIYLLGRELVAVEATRAESETITATHGSFERCEDDCDCDRSEDAELKFGFRR